MAKAATKTAKPTTRKSTAKKANAPMKNKPAKKPAKAAVKATATKAAKTMAKTAKPAVRKSAAKRVEKVETKAGLPALKTQMNRVVKVLRDDCAAVADGKGNEQQFRDLVQAVTRAVKNAKKKQGIEFA